MFVAQKSYIRNELVGREEDRRRFRETGQARPAAHLRSRAEEGRKGVDGSPPEGQDGSAERAQDELGQGHPH